MSKKEFDLRIFGLASVGAKGQVVIPAVARRGFGLAEGDEVVVFGSEKHKFLGVMTEENFREILAKFQSHIDEGLTKVAADREKFADIAHALDRVGQEKSDSK